MVGRSPPFISHNFDFLPKLSTSQKSAQMFTMTMAKFLRPAAATSTTTQNHDMKSDTLTEEQKQKILLQNRRTLRSFLKKILREPRDDKIKDIIFSRSNIELNVDISEDNFEMVDITCPLINLDFFDSRFSLRRKCLRMNAKVLQRKYESPLLPGIALRMNQKNQIELFFSIPLASLTPELWRQMMRPLQDAAVECKLRLLISRNKSRWSGTIKRD
jgi:hypothetical protein